MAAIVAEDICIFSSFTCAEGDPLHFENRSWSRLDVLRPELWPAISPQRHRNGWPFQAAELLGWKDLITQPSECDDCGAEQWQKRGAPRGWNKTFASTCWHYLYSQVTNPSWCNGMDFVKGGATALEEFRPSFSNSLAGHILWRYRKRKVLLPLNGYCRLCISSYAC
jgi:hypothetical protein